MKRGRSFFGTYLQKEYLDMFRELCEILDTTSLFTTNYTEEKIHRKINDEIQILISRKKIVVPKGISTTSHKGNIQTSKHMCLDITETYRSA